MLTIGSLFSGIGGLELGLEMAGLGPTLWQVEKDPFCRVVLAHHWPRTERFDDVCTVGSTGLAPVDLICGGFPCQDVSSAGKGAGLAGERSGLWREYARIVRELRPAWVVVENVTSGAAKWLDAVVGELDALGYACLPCPVSARDVGAPHRRGRLFVVANAHGVPTVQPWRRAVPPDASAGRAAADALHEPRALQHEEGREVPRLVADVASVAPGGLARSPRPKARVDASDAYGSRREGSGLGEEVSRREGLAPHVGWSPEPGILPLVHGLSGGLAGRRRRARIRALGNSVVPQCAEVVGWVIRELAGLTPEVARVG